ncbi:hypothetical protein [Pseudonocardia acaciae]|uniref:hypothetical protein n=1 Tax=Pseudonocardia acaciae TaxID=551276 RepID=UPI000B1F6270|nr:hypothetical protein [Pseudonocardia acaciae]
MTGWLRRWRGRHVVDMQWRELQARVVAQQETRRRQLAGQSALVARLEELLYRHDPIGLNFGHNADEYRPEAETITLRIPEAATEHDLQRIVHEEFVHWFGSDTAGPEARYASITREFWEIYRESA